jgi:hypothetical protein
MLGDLAINQIFERRISNREQAPSHQAFLPNLSTKPPRQATKPSRQMSVTEEQ